MSDHHPTRRCPHRWCRPAHAVLAAIGAVFLAEILFHGLASVLFTILLAGISYAVGSMVHGRSPMDATLDDTAIAGVTLVVRPGWARAAVGCDLFYVCVGLLGVTVLPLQGHESTVPTPDAAGFIVLAVAVGLMFFSEYAHRQATRPAKPKRVLVPVLSSTS